MMTIRACALFALSGLTGGWRGVRNALSYLSHSADNGLFCAVITLAHNAITISAAAQLQLEVGGILADCI
jgi:hypothetical protein